MRTDLFPETLPAEAPTSAYLKATQSALAPHIIPFRDTPLVCLEQGEEVFVAMRSIVEGMGLSWSRQYRKLMADSARFCIHRMTTQMPGDDQRREHTFIPLRRLNGWLMSISSSRVRPEVRETVVAYQQECDEVLFRHFFHDLHIESSALRLLRPRTVAVARLTLEGKSRREIAALLAISAASVTYHRAQARRLGLLAA